MLQTGAREAIDTKSKLRVHVGSWIGYGYDFQEQHEREDSRTFYERAVKNTKKMGQELGAGAERLVADGIEEDRLGWYITELPG